MTDIIKNGEKTAKGRAWEIDMARGIAVILMAAFHAVFDLTAYYGAGIDYSSGTWFWVGRISALLFMFVSGISSSFSRSLIERGFVVLACGLVVTLFSLPVMGENYVRFGILHFFGTAMILKGVFEMLVKSEKVRMFTAAALIPVSYFLGTLMPKIVTDTPLLLPLGVMPIGFSSFDYYPLFPWLAVFSAGILTASVFYKGKRSLFKYNPFETGNRAIKAVCFLGRNSLFIYLIHQPVIMAVLYIVFTISKILS